MSIDQIPTAPRTDTDAAVEAGLTSAEPTPLGDGRFYAFAHRDSVTVVDLEREAEWNREVPRRKEGARTVFDSESFIAYVTRHRTIGTEVFADVEGRVVKAIIDSHGPADGLNPGLPGNRAHTVTLQIRETPAWKAWTAQSGKMLDQQAFAEFIEQHTQDIVEPAGAEVLEVAQSIAVQQDVQFNSSTRLDNGQVQFGYVENTTTATAGEHGNLQIPARFTLGIKPFEGSDPFRVEVALRYRLQRGGLTLGYVLLAAENVVQDAFDDVVAQVRVGVDPVVVLLGKP